MACIFCKRMNCRGRFLVKVFLSQCRMCDAAPQLALDRKRGIGAARCAGIQGPGGIRDSQGRHAWPGSTRLAGMRGAGRQERGPPVAESAGRYGRRSTARRPVSRLPHCRRRDRTARLPVPRVPGLWPPAVHGGKVRASASPPRVRSPRAPPGRHVGAGAVRRLAPRRGALLRADHRTGMRTRKTPSDSSIRRLSVVTPCDTGSRTTKSWRSSSRSA